MLVCINKNGKIQEWLSNKSNVLPDETEYEKRVTLLITGIIKANYQNNCHYTRQI